MSSTSVTDGIELATLVCERDAAMALITLPRLQRGCHGMVRMTLLEDGTLSQRSEELLLSKIENCTLIRRSSVEERIAAQLRNRPHCRAHLKEHPLSLKLIAFPLVLGFTPIFFDVDILIFKSFSAAHVANLGRTQFVFMQDWKDGYSGRSIHLKFKYRLPLVSRLNSGIMAIPESGYDLDFIEWFLGVPEFRVFPHLLEQTCWSVMPRTGRTHYIDDRQFYCATPSRIYNGHAVGVHYVYNMKIKLAKEASVPLETIASPPELLTRAAPGFGVRRMLSNVMNRCREKMRCGS